MKRILLLIPALLLICFLFGVRCEAGTLDDLEDSLSSLNDSLSDDARDKMAELGFDGSFASFGDLGLENLSGMILSELSKGLSVPLAAGCVILCVMILSALMEGYTHSLRYTETRDVMAVVTSLLTATVLIGPITLMIQDAVSVINGASSLMLLYVPVMVGILSFSGHAVQAGGYYATVMTASQAVAQFSSRLFPQMMCAYLALSVTSGLSGRMRLNGICEMLSRLMKWALVLLMTVFTAVLSLQSVMARAGDTVATRAVRFTLSSVIPVIGSAVSEGYKTIQGSVDLLRSGAGVFVIAALLISFLPILARVILWLVSVNIANYAADALGVTAPGVLLRSVGSALTLLIAVIVSVMTVFIISTAALMRIGGAA